MTLGLAGVRSAPLHELEAEWKADARHPRSFGQLIAEPCVCGGVITARATEPAITRAVADHNRSTAHGRAMVAMGWR